MENLQLKPCPFCGCDNLIVQYCGDGRVVVCNHCGANGAVSKNNFCEKWNTRAVHKDMRPDGEGKWRYAINHGPDDEQDYAWVYDGSNKAVGNLKIHHAMFIVQMANTDTDRVC